MEKQQILEAVYNMLMGGQTGNTPLFVDWYITKFEYHLAGTFHENEKPITKEMILSDLEQMLKLK